jgi:hypothetical protein
MTGESYSVSYQTGGTCSERIEIALFIVCGAVKSKVLLICLLQKGRKGNGPPEHGSLLNGRQYGVAIGGGFVGVTSRNGI